MSRPSFPSVKTEPVFDTSGDPRRAGGRRLTADPPAPSPGAPDRRRVLTACCLVAGSGLLLVVAGSFLPWVVSGNVTRSSYAIVGVVDRLGFADDGPVAILVTGWPFVGALCVAPVIAAILRWWRIAGVLCLLYGLITGALSFGLLFFAGGRGGLGVRVEPTGPAVMAAGAVLLIGGGIALAAGVGSPIRRVAARL